MKTRNGPRLSDLSLAIVAYVRAQDGRAVKFREIADAVCRGDEDIARRAYKLLENLVRLTLITSTGKQGYRGADYTPGPRKPGEPLGEALRQTLGRGPYRLPAAGARRDAHQATPAPVPTWQCVPNSVWALATVGHPRSRD